MAEFDEQIRLLRAWITTQIPTPMIAVLATQSNDGKAYLVDGLVAAYANGGYRTAIVDVGNEAFTIRHAHSDQTPNARTVTFESARFDNDVNSDIHAFGSIVAEWRSKFDAIIVQVGEDILSEASLRFLEKVDGVIIARENGRADHGSDGFLITTLNRIKVRILAVVPTGKAAQEYRPAQHQADTLVRSTATLQGKLLPPVAF